MRSQALVRKGLIRVGQGFSVNAVELNAGSGQVSGLQDRCEILSEDAADTLTAMAGSAGHADLASALSDAAGQGAKAFWGMGTAYGHVSSSLSASAANYTKTDEGIAGQARSIFRGLR
jgi:hypothetical protein